MDLANKLTEQASEIQALRSELASIKRGEFKNITVAGTLILKDASGNRRCLLGTDAKNAVVLALFDTNKEPRLTIAVNNDEPIITLYSAAGEAVVSILSEGDRHSLRICRTNGDIAAGMTANNEDAFILLYDHRNGVGRASLTVFDDDVALALSDAEEKDRVVATFRDGSPAILIADNDGQITHKIP